MHVASFVVALAAAVAAGPERSPRVTTPDLTQIAGSGRVVNRAATPISDGARRGLRLDERPGQGVAWIAGIEFEAGTIDVEVRGKDALQRSFVGIAFHGLDDSRYEVVYVRPFNFRAEDPVRRSHAIQYAAHPDYPWSRLRSERPGEFENGVDPGLDPNDWVHLRIEVSPARVRAFVADAQAATLDVPRIVPTGKGSLGLWVGEGSGGDFANLRVEARAEKAGSLGTGGPPLSQSRAERTTPTAPAGGTVFITHGPDARVPVPTPVDLQRCALPTVPEGALCGECQVYENHHAARGRRIALKIVVLPATEGRLHPDPLFFFGGGPGQAITKAGLALARSDAEINRTRDIVLVDQRGTGGSHPLNCDLYPGDGPQRFLGAFLPVKAISGCRERLQTTADLALYTTSVFADDAAEVLQALGYDRVNVSGASYGTRAALVFLRRHPDRVRSVILQGVSPTDHRVPLTFPRDAQRALDLLIQECERTPSCRSAFPNAKADAGMVWERLRGGPLSVAVLDPETAKVVSARLSRELAAEAVRRLLYFPTTARFIPSLMRRAAAGDFTPLAEFGIQARRDVMNAEGMGLYLSVTCAEDLPAVDPGEAVRAAAGTFLGDYRFREQARACRHWPAAAVPAGFHATVASETPTLVFSGELDPTTPPQTGAQAAAHLKNGLHVVIPYGAHSFVGLADGGCISRLRTEFIQRGSGAGLDASCAAGIRPPPFAPAWPETRVAEVSTAELTPYEGVYRRLDDGAEVTFVVDGPRLRVAFPERTYTFAPVDGRRFRAAGAPELYLDVAVESANASASLVRAGVEQTRLLRSH